MTMTKRTDQKMMTTTSGKGNRKNPISCLYHKSMRQYYWRRNYRNNFVDEMKTRLADVCVNEHKQLPYKDLLPFLHLDNTSVKDNLLNVITGLNKVRLCNEQPRFWKCRNYQFCEYCLSTFRYRLLKVLEDLKDSNSKYNIYFRKHRLSIPRGILFCGFDASYMLHGSLGPHSDVYGYLMKPFQRVIQSDNRLQHTKYSNDMYSFYSAIFEGYSMYNPTTDAYTFSKEIEEKRKSELDKIILKGGGTVTEKKQLWNSDYLMHSIFRTLAMERRAISLRPTAGTAHRIAFYPDYASNLMNIELQSVILEAGSLESVLPDGLLYFGPTEAPRRLKLNVNSDVYCTSSVSVIKKTLRAKTGTLHKLLETTFPYHRTCDNLTPLETAIYTLGLAGNVVRVSTSGLFRE